jgi:amino acid adenylation domain-containing protein
MNIENVLIEFADAGLYLAVRRGKLVCKAEQGALTLERRQIIKEYKADFMAFFQRVGDEGHKQELTQLCPAQLSPKQLSPAQQRLWFIDQLTESSVNYLTPLTYRLNGILDVQALRRALARIVGRHESLRSVIELIDDQPVAVVRDVVEVVLEPESLEGLHTHEQAAQIQSLLQQSLATSFDLSRDIPLKARLFRLAHNQHLLMLTLHHIACDGWSVENLLHELSVLYTAFISGQGDPLPPLPLQYGDYAAWQGQWLQGERLQQQLDYWCNQLEGAPPVHALPLDQLRPVQPRYAGASFRQQLPASVQQGLLAVGQSQGATLFMTLLGAFAVLIARWSGQTDVVIGTPIANRPRKELASLIGFFANTLALRSSIADNPTFTEVLQHVKQMTLDALEYQSLPFEMLVEKLNPPRSLNLAPLVQIMFSLQEFDENTALNLPGINSTALAPEAVNAKFDLNLCLYETADGLAASWDYNRDLFHRDTIERMAGSFKALLTGIVASPERSVQQLPLLDESTSEINTVHPPLLHRPLPDVVGVHRLFEIQAVATPASVALDDGKHRYSYAKLNCRANRVAHALLALGIKPDSRVAIYVERSVDMVVGILGVLKAGGAYVPLDPAHPMERLRLMLEDSGALAVLTQKRLMFKSTSGRTQIPVFEMHKRPWLQLDDDEIFSPYNDVNPVVAALSRTHLAYVIYTSGSTGTPKGVMVEHGNALNLVAHALRDFCDLSSSDFSKSDLSNTDHSNSDHSNINASLWSSFGFDVSVFEIFVALAQGSTLHIVPDDIRADIPAFLHWLIDRQITQAYLPPFFVRALRDCKDKLVAALSLRRILVGVEPLLENQLYRLQQQLPDLVIYNSYGPSETTVYSTSYHAIQEIERIAPIGQAIGNTQIRLLDDALRPVPVGVVGEIHIAGLGVARGYLNRPELTEERFIYDTSSETSSKTSCKNRHTRMYKTGDLARWLPDGQLEFRGRKDLQIKFNGIRIEPGEIETVLCTHPEIKEAVITVRKDEALQSARLVAYLVLQHVNNVSSNQWREYLSQHLPSYMLPSAFVTLAQLPLTVSGKLDSNALPEPSREAYTTENYVEPETPLEQQLTKIWQDLLQIEPISAAAGFFELGGHSLLLTRLQNKICAHFAVDIALKELFAAQTIREQARIIASLAEQATKESLPSLQLKPPGAPAVLSFAQQRLWFVDQIGNAGAVYNIPCALHLQGELQRDRLHQALTSVVERHQVLRTSLVSVNGEAQPRLQKTFLLVMDSVDIRELPELTRSERLQQQIDAEAARAFDLSSDLLLRTTLVRLADQEHVLLLTVHHIAADGWSMGVLLDEVATLYNNSLCNNIRYNNIRYNNALSADCLEPLDLQYVDYAHWQQQWLQGERLERQWQYWQKQLVHLPVLHNLPLDFSRPHIQRYRGAVHRQQLSVDLLNGLQSLAGRFNTTLFITLQTAFSVLLARWSGGTDIVIGTPTAHRRHEKLMSLIGFFVNTLVLRNDWGGNPRFVDALAVASSVAIDAYQHQDLPFEMLVDRLCPQRSLSHSPLFQIMLVLDNDGGKIPLFDGLEITDIATEFHHAKFDLTLSLNESSQGLRACWDYNRDLFHRETISRIANSFEVMLTSIVADPLQHIQQLPLLSAEQRLLMEVKKSYQPLPPVAGVHRLFEARSAATPEVIAVDDGERRISYFDLNRRANRVAHALLALGVKPDSRVAIYVERGVAMLVGILAVLKAGGAYVPLDPAQPLKRLKTMLLDSKAAVLLTQNAQIDSLITFHPATSNIVHLLLDDEAAFAEFDQINPEIAELNQSHLAYVIYTSGSTGTPKGVMVEHGNVLNLVEDSLQQLGEADTAMNASQWAGIGFDASVAEMFITLAAGGTLHIVPEVIRADVDAFFQWLIERSITQAFLPPFFVRALNGYPDEAIAALALRRVAVGVEPLSEMLLYRLQQLLPGLVVDNGYGPSEATVYCTRYCDIRQLKRSTPIGLPIINTQIQLLDDAMQPVPVGVVGEICISGRGIARGYLDRVDLTAQCFVHDACGNRLYKSGDLGRWLPDGQLEFRGRKDLQIKFNGVRIEPGEIEAALCMHAEVNEAAVVMSYQPEDNNTESQRLVAYVVLQQGKNVSSQQLREFLRQRLPLYMQPSAYVALARLPLSINGKLDIKGLPAPSLSADSLHDCSCKYVPAESALEQQLVDMWQELLQRRPISAATGFFDLGGHSLLLTRLHNQMCAYFTVEFPLRELFTAQTIREQARLIATLEQQPAKDAALLLQARPSDAPMQLSFAQQRLWFIDQLDNTGAVYNMPCALHLQGELQSDVLHRALETIVARHQVLRTSLPTVNGEAQPQLQQTFELIMDCDDVSGRSEQARREQLQQQIDTEAVRAFDLSADLLLRAKLLRLSEQEHVLLLTLHHIAADGWSIGVLLNELAKLYNTRIAADCLPSLTLQYADYAHWQQQWLQGERLQAQWQYWQTQLAQLPALHNLPLDYPRPETQRYRGSIHRQAFSAAVLSALQKLASGHKTTLFITLQAAFSVLLARWSGDTDIVVGTPIANRRHEKLTPLVGLFVNTMVLRNDLADNPRFVDVLSAVNIVALDAYQHQDLPFEMLVDRLRAHRSMSHSPLFQIMLTWDNDDGTFPSFDGLEITDVAGQSHQAKFDLTLNLSESSDTLTACWNYNRDLFSLETIARVASSFEVMLESIAADPLQRIQQLSLLKSEALMSTALNVAANDAVNDTRQPLPPVAGVHQLIEARAAATPKLIAVDDGERRISYCDLNRRANRVAHALLAQGLTPDSRVAIYIKRGVDRVVGILAVLKAGGAYVPLDPAHPMQRLNTILTDSGAVAVLTETDLLTSLNTSGTLNTFKVPASNVPHWLINDEQTFVDFGESNPVISALGQSNLAYVIYTSGSTGVPKGVMVEHGNLLNLVNDNLQRLKETDTVTIASQWASIGFDASVAEIFISLAQGCTLHIVPEVIRADVDGFLQWLIDRCITQAFLPPFFIRALNAYSDQRIAALSLRRVLLGVESLPEKMLYRLQKLLPGLVVQNGYGPSETTVYSSLYTDIRDIERNAPVGRAIANTKISLLDEALQPVPEGVVGEIYITGKGVARGYLNREQLTAERFVHDTHGNRMYKTGDLGRWLPEGQLEFRGRKDQQIKFNGVRIEPGEIEAQLCLHAAVKEAAVVIRQVTDANRVHKNRHLVAYVVTRHDKSVSFTQLREFLCRRLPPYMQPSAYVTVARLPLTVNGKLNTKALPAPAMDAYTSDHYVPPETVSEKQLVMIWQDLLQLKPISVMSSFFDLGGHSLSAVRLMSSVREVAGTTLPISLLFKAPTIRALAREIDNDCMTDNECVAVLREQGEENPLFLFHPAGGEVMCYQPLLQYLESNRPVYGFMRSEASNQRVPAFKSIEQLADEYIARLLELQPAGPYSLIGWSSGGLIAVEAAARLESRGHSVAAVLLIDTMLATGTDVPEQFREKGLHGLQQLSAQAACELMREYDPDLPMVTPVNGVLDISSADYFNYLAAANQIALDFYQPDFKLKARVHYFACIQNNILNTVAERITQMQALVLDRINSEAFDATHFSIFEQPCILELGRAIDRATAECNKKESILPYSGFA